MKIVSTLIVAVLPCAAVLSSLAPRADAQPRSNARTSRHIIVCVDGVGFSVLERMRAEGHFRMFQEPARMIAPFPSLTNLSLSEILRPAGAGEAVGYEDNFFDTERNRMSSVSGGVLGHLRGSSAFRQLFDYHPSAVKSSLEYVAPPLGTYLEALSELARLRQKARSSRENVFFAYTFATDTLAHLGGERMLCKFLARLDDSLTDIVRESATPVEVTIFSDHGNRFMKYRRAPLKSALRGAGFRLESRVRGPRSVVLPQFGLIGCAVLFSKEDNEPRLAEAAAAARGVDFVAYETGGVVRVMGRGGQSATIERKGDRIRYRTERGDPLGLARESHELVARGKADQNGFIADADWFEATMNGERPDALRRIYEGTVSTPRYRASVTVSFADGYYSGSLALDAFTVLRATHGNSGREQSFGVVMNNVRALPAYLRAKEVWSAIGAPVLSKPVKARAPVRCDARRNGREVW